MSMITMVIMEFRVHFDDLKAVIASLSHTDSFQLIYPNGSSSELETPVDVVIEELLCSNASEAPNVDRADGLDAPNREVTIRGWVPADKLKQTEAVIRNAVSRPVLIEKIEKIEGAEARSPVSQRFRGPISEASSPAIQSFTPESTVVSPELLLAEQSLPEEIPVAFKKNTYLDGFRSLFVTWAMPRYGDIDPSWPVAIFCTVLFGLMFGDLGQGAIIVALGLLVRRARNGFLTRFSRFWPAIVSVGLASTLTGLLYGSVFANEELLIPLEHVLTGIVLGRPQDRFVTILPEPSPLSSLKFFAFGEMLGVVMMLTGMVINIVNLWRRAEYREALLGETGAVTAFLCLEAAGIFVRAINGMNFGWFDVVAMGLPLAILLIHSPTETLRSCTELLVNGVTYLMIGAYAMSHALLSLAFSRVALLMSTAGLGLLWELLIYALGNFIILALEGTIVLLQCQRLMVSEFFPKFLGEPGRPFVPLRIINS